MLLPGRYKGNRRRREPPIVAECGCGWKSRPLNPKQAEQSYVSHVITDHIEAAGAKSTSPNHGAKS